MNKGEDYHGLCPVYGLGIINDQYDPSENWFHHYRTVEMGNSEEDLPGLELIFLELPKFKPQTFEHRKTSVLWLRFLNEINDRLVDVPEEFMQSPDLTKAMEIAQESSYSPEELDAYDKYWDAIQVEKTVAGDAMRAGLVAGKKEVLEEGKREKEKQLIQRMLLQGFDLQTISQITELPQETIQSLMK